MIHMDHIYMYIEYTWFQVYTSNGQLAGQSGQRAAPTVMERDRLAMNSPLGSVVPNWCFIAPGHMQPPAADWDAAPGSSC
jgi:hypothetical protein